VDGLKFHISLKKKIAFMIFFGLFGILLSVSSVGHLLDRAFYDCLVVAEPDRSRADQIVIVAIDEPSFAKLNQQWPWPRQIHAQLIETLFSAGAKTIALDILFPEPSSPEDDAALAAVLNENVVLASSLETIDHSDLVSVMQILPLPLFLEQGCKTGLDILPLDPDGFLRTSAKRLNQSLTFAAAAATAFCDQGCAANLKNTENNSNKWLINFQGPPGSIKTISYYEVLDSKTWLSENFFKDKLIFVGFSTRNVVDLETAFADHYSTPHVRFGSEHMSGVEIQANIAANFINQTGMKEIELPILSIYAILVWLIIGIMTLRLTVMRSGFVFLILLVITGGGIWFAFLALKLFVPPSLILFPGFFTWCSGWMTRYYENAKEKLYIKQVFSRYVSTSVVTYLLNNPEKLKLGGDFFEGSVLFLDIKNFTSLASNTPAKELIRILSRYLGTFADIALAHNGMVDKIAGDAVMAVWGVPIEQKDHAILACRAALEMEKAYLKLRKEDREDFEYPLSIRIGINSGTLLAGNIGGKYFSDFTVHGVDVNLANKLETLNNIYGTRILIGETTKSQLTDDFITKKIDCVQPKGYLLPVTIYELKSFCD